MKRSKPPKVEYEIHYGGTVMEIETKESVKDARKAIRAHRKQHGTSIKEIDVYVFRHIEGPRFMGQSKRRKRRGSRTNVA